MLDALLVRAKREALADYRFQWLRWGLLAPHMKDVDRPDAPRPPRILEE